jgi:hypothetical protein
MTGMQMLLALGAAILLSITILITNKNILTTEDVLYDSNFEITATSIGTSLIEDASKKKFDEVTDTMAIDKTLPLTAPELLGTEPGEDPTNRLEFDDFDDYNGYTITDSTMPTAIFEYKCKVEYVDETDPNTAISKKSFHKKLTVKVWSKSMKDTVMQSTIYSYWYFR